MIKIIKLNKKQNIILGIAVVAVIGLATVSGFSSFDLEKIKKAEAGASDNVSGFAWSENIGWISFNNLSDISSVNYGVRIDFSTGNFSGFAWSENIGWIQFNPSGPYLSSPPNSVKMDLTTRNITGWARAVAYGDGWDGWIKFGYGPSGSFVDNNGDFHGWAWGGDVVGWISLNHNDAEAGAGNLYKVRTVAVVPLSDLTASTPIPITAPAGAISFSSTITNGGMAGTGAGFTNIFQVSASSNGNNPTNYPTSTASSLATGASVVTSKSITLTAGTHYMRVCADSNISIPESNEFNNCSSGVPWTTITILPPLPLPVHGSCATPQIHYNCSSGTSANNVNGISQWTWSCNGLNGGTNAQCSELKKKPKVIEN